MRHPICAFVKVRDRISIVPCLSLSSFFHSSVLFSMCAFLIYGDERGKGDCEEGCVKGENRTSGGAFLNVNRKAWL
jgi:hypothetical protein